MKKDIVSYNITADLCFCLAFPNKMHFNFFKSICFSKCIFNQNYPSGSTDLVYLYISR